MKKLIAISVVFALAAGAAFAVDLGGSVVGTVKVIKADSGDGSAVEASAALNNVALEGAGEVGDGKFGGWIRVKGFDTPLTMGELNGHDWEKDLWRGFRAHGYAWWKPIDQFKLSIGGNPDGIWAKEGGAAWMFYQTVSDTEVVNPGNAWGGGYGSINMRNAFYGGFPDERLFMTISPADIVDINIGIPFFKGGEAADVFLSSNVQVDLKLSFGNIALTYDFGDGRDDNGKIYGYFGLTAIDNLGLDVGLGFGLNEYDPLFIGLAAKYSFGSFGIKFRTVMGIPTEDKGTFNVLADILPFFAINDNLRASVSAGLSVSAPNSGDPTVAWHVNPYVEVGQEWGPKFVAGIRLWSGSASDVLHFELPVALHVGF